MNLKKVEDCIYVFKKNCQSLLGKHSLNDNVLNFNFKDGSLIHNLKIQHVSGKHLEVQGTLLMLWTDKTQFWVGFNVMAS